MDANDRWVDFKATETFECLPFAFEWRARLGVLPGVWVIAKDGQRDGDGWGGAKLWGIKSMGQRSGPDVFVMQMIRAVAELAWLPDMATEIDGLRWEDAGDQAFMVHVDSAVRDLTVRFDTDSSGDVTRASCDDRPFDVPGGFDLAPWRCDYGEHDELDGVRIPRAVTVTYDFEDESWEYFRAEVASRSSQPE